MIEVSQEPSAASDLQQSTIGMLHQVHEAGQPVVLGVNNQTEFIIQDGTSFRMLIELVDRLETIEAVREGMRSIERGEGQPAEEAFAELRRKHDIPREE
jgi:PHD/YefM family antitoxin component YafN of YafNO toxin-antitoxin module